MTEKKKKLTGQQGELMRALDITPDDLYANHEGYITEDQQETVMKRQSYQLRQYQIITTVFSLMGVFFIGIGAFNMSKLVPLIFIALFFIVMGLSIGAFTVYQQRRIKAELKNNRFETTQGIAVVVTTLEESHIEINGLKLQASPDVLRRVQHLQPYIIHYLPESKVILSMEHIEEDNNIRESAGRLQDSDVIEQSYTQDEANSQQMTSS